MEPRLPIHGLSAPALQRAAQERLPSGAGVALQVYRQVMREQRFAPEELGLPPRSVAAWREQFCFELPRVLRSESEDGALGGATRKVVFGRGGREYETVLLPMGEARSSLCVSSQIGCGMACGFCETGRMGLLGNLGTDEILGQVLWGMRQRPRPGNIVFMGMGEALDNCDTLLRVLEILHDPAGLAFSLKNVTVCTVGHVPGLRRLAAAGHRRLNVSLSLNAADDALRDRMMPMNKRWPLAEVQAALLACRHRANLQFGINWCLMPGINDQREQARKIAAFCKPLGRCMVYLIPYNPGSFPLTRAPEAEEVDRFVGWLREAGLMVRRRITKGREVMAACGQLGNVELRKQLRESGA